MKQLKIALDWTPNINHIGFFVAQEKGFYKNHNLQVEITDPSTDNYAITPAKKVELGDADFALCPTESLISYRTKSNPFDLMGVAAIFKEDVSAIVTKSSIAKSPKELDGKSYASYKARYEDEIVKQMIKNDGGQGELQITYPEKLGIWNTLLSGDADSTWIFLNWEGVESSNEELSYFKMKDHNVPYSYSPVIAVSQTRMDNELDVYKSFIRATRQGYIDAQNNRKEAIEILSKYLTEKDKNIDLKKALDVSCDHFGSPDEWGQMDESEVNIFLNWIYENNLENQKLQASDIITNKLFE